MTTVHAYISPTLLTISLCRLEETACGRGALALSDEIVQFGTPNSRTTPPDHPTRLVIIKVKPHDSRRSKNGVSGPSSDGYLRIVTNNMEVPAEIIAALYELRWTVELYFRIIKQLLGCRHLLSTKRGRNDTDLPGHYCMHHDFVPHRQDADEGDIRNDLFLSTRWAELEEVQAHIEKLKSKES